MDGRGLVGPERGQYARDVRAIDQLLRAGGTVYVALADRGGRLNLVLTRRHKLVCVGAEPEGQSVESQPSWLFVAAEGHGAYWFRTDTFLTPAYVAEKLGFTAGGDGEIVAEFLTRLDAARKIEGVA